MWGALISPDALKGDVRTFYQIAATLIPLLLFGGVVVERFIPPKRRWRPGHFLATASVIPIVGFYSIYAEVLAIQALVTGETDTLTSYVVSGAIVGGMLAVICSIWLPWGLRAIQAIQKSGESVSRPMLWTVALPTVAIGVILFLRLASAVDDARSTERARNYAMAAQKLIDELNVVRGSINREMVRSRGLQQELMRAKEFHEGRRSLALLTARNRLRQFIVLDRKKEDRLILESVNLYRETVGLPTLKRIIDKRHPPPRRARGEATEG